MILKNKSFYAFVIVIGAVLLIFFCVKFFSNSDDTKIKTLAYDYNKKGDHSVYILENEKYEPYVVLSKNYYGKTLLMRKYLMEEDRKFNPYEGNGFLNSYYPNSLMDQYLSQDFFSSLSPTMQAIITEIDIDITTKESIELGPVLETEKLRRKVFLLSSYEVSVPDFNLLAKEGVRLKYFSDATVSDFRIAYTKNGEARPYWLRTEDASWNDYTATCVSGYDGAVGDPPVDKYLAVRPVSRLKVT